MRFPLSSWLVKVLTGGFILVIKTSFFSSPVPLSGTAGTNYSLRLGDRVAFIIQKSAPDTQCALSRASFDRQRDIYVLAQMGEKSSARLWNDFAAVYPNQARVVIADINADKALDVKANKHLDRILVKADKKDKKDKPSKAAIRENEAWLKSMLNSPNPQERESARQSLGLDR